MPTLFSYAGTGNLGDAIQTLALQRLLPGPVEFSERDAVTTVPAQNATPCPGLLMNGFLDARWRGAPPGSAIFAGVHVPDRWVAARVCAAARPGVPLGARDPHSQALLDEAAAHGTRGGRSGGEAAAHGTRGGRSGGEHAEAECIGCATLTLPRSDGPRAGVVAVDALEPPPEAERRSHYLPATLPWPEQCAQAAEALERYRTAEAVVTTRLHVLLPCLAYGTPVRLERGAAFERDPRWTLAQALGAEPGRWLELDVEPWAARFRAFLAGVVTSRLAA